ncbi:MAG: glutamate--tRNA ligase [Cytophagales bacterium]|nr:MAG: glutamate--tRNA ligase [Cytophagales bacterium]TAF61713.1 MAG: glutamate--tRNA ligase [Cytophagales bacterium]
MEKTVRVRFAPSPTGALHIGGVRTALFNYLFAKKHHGQFLIRIEDTDQTRFVPGAEEYILKALAWCGIIADESPAVGGPCAPYRQSERKAMYAQYAYRMIEEGNAYYAFDTEQELEEMRERLKAARVASPQYNAVTRMQMKNSLTLPEEEVKERLASGAPYVIRVKMPRKDEVRLNDLVRGWVVVHTSTLDDKVLLKSDGMPTYHLANVVDDYLMKITHVIRGEEWLPSAPLHVLLYKYLGWEAQMPQFAHLPLLLKPDGNGKLSKRDGDRLGFPVFPLNWQDPFKPEDNASGYKEAGYFPDAFINFLALLGWNPGTTQEIFSMQELIEAFSIERINKAGIKFDIDKARWYNQQYLKHKDEAELATYLLGELSKHKVECSVEKAQKIVRLMKERAVFLSDIWSEAQYLFFSPKDYDEKAAAKWSSEAASVLAEYAKDLSAHSGSIDAEKAKQLLHDRTEQMQIKIGKIMPALRLALTGRAAGPDLMDIIMLLGADEAASRIQAALLHLKVAV